MIFFPVDSKLVDDARNGEGTRPRERIGPGLAPTESMSATTPHFQKENRQRQLTIAGRLTRLEKAAAIPVVVGEIGEWSERVRDRIHGVATKYDDFRAAQTALHEEVTRRDPALTHRIVRLQRWMDRCEEELGLLNRAAAEVSRADVGAYAAAEELRSCLLGWVTELRTLEREASTWWTEALYRDRGVAD